MYFWGNAEVKVIIPVFMDDLTIMSKSPQHVKQIKESLDKVFNIHDMGLISFLLGISITCD